MTRTEIEILVARFDQIVRTGNMRESTALLPSIIHGLLDMIEQSNSVSPVSYSADDYADSDSDDAEGDAYSAPVGYDANAAHELIERINAAPDRQIYKIDVGDMDPEEAGAVITELQKQHGANVELPEALQAAEEAHRGAAIEYAARMLQASEPAQPEDDSKAKPKPKSKK